MEIVFLDKKTIGEVSNFNLLHKLGTVDVYDLTEPGDVIARSKGKEVIIAAETTIGRKEIDSLPDLKLICITVPGTGNIDVEYAREKGIDVRTTLHYSMESVAQSTFAMILHLLNRTDYYNDYVKSGAYSKGGIFTHHGPAFWELNGKRMGIIGLGKIGRRVAGIAESFGMEVVFFSTSGRNNNINYKRFDLKTLLNTSDVVSIHAPLTDRTRNLITMNELKLMRSCAILINTGSGAIVNEEDLANALNENIIAAAGLDVHSSEPMKPGNILLKISDKGKILLTPHIAWASIESRARLIEAVAGNIEQYRRDRSNY